MSFRSFHRVQEITRMKTDSTNAPINKRENGSSHTQATLTERASHQLMPWYNFSYSRPARQEYESGKISRPPQYPISPVATVAYIRSQLRDQTYGNKDNLQLSSGLCHGNQNKFKNPKLQQGSGNGLCQTRRDKNGEDGFNARYEPIAKTDPHCDGQSGPQTKVIIEMQTPRSLPLSGKQLCGDRGSSKGHSYNVSRQIDHQSRFDNIATQVDMVSAKMTTYGSSVKHWPSTRKESSIRFGKHVIAPRSVQRLTSPNTHQQVMSPTTANYTYHDVLYSTHRFGKTVTKSSSGCKDDANKTHTIQREIYSNLSMQRNTQADKTDTVKTDTKSAAGKGNVYMGKGGGIKDQSHQCFVWPRIPNLRGQKATSEVPEKHMTEQKHDIRQGKSVKMIDHPGVESQHELPSRSTFPRRNVPVQLRDQQQTSAMAMNRKETEETRAKAKTRISISSLESVGPRTTASSSFATSTPLDPRKQSKSSPAPRNTNTSTSPTVESPATRSEPRPSSHSIFFHTKRDTGAPFRDPPKSAPANRAAGRNVHKGLKPVNLFPEWTGQSQRTRGESFGRRQQVSSQTRQGNVRWSDNMMTQPLSVKSRTTFSASRPSVQDSRHDLLQKENFTIAPVTLHNKQNKAALTSRNYLVGSSTDEKSSEIKGKYWFHDNTIRRLSAIEPSLFHGSETVNKRYSRVGVKQAKSVDIAAIYSKLGEVPVTKCLVNYNTEQAAHTFERPSQENRMLSHELPQKEMCRHDQALSQDAQHNQKKKETTHSKSELLTTRKHKSAPFTIEDYGIPDEEFRPAELFLEDLYYSGSENRNSPATNLAQHKGNSSAKFVDSAKTYAVQNCNQRQFPTEKRTSQCMTEIQADKIHRQSLPASSIRLCSMKGVAEGAMSQASIREYIERNRQRTRQSLPNQKVYSKSRELWRSNIDHGAVKRQRLHDIAEDNIESNTARISIAKQQQTREMSKKESWEQPVTRNATKTYINGDVNSQLKAITPNEVPGKPFPTTKSAQASSKEEYFMQLDAAVSRRHTIHFGSLGQDIIRDLSRHPSIETLSSGYRSLERNERRMSQRTGKLPQKFSNDPHDRLVAVPREKKIFRLGHEHKQAASSIISDKKSRQSDAKRNQVCARASDAYPSPHISRLDCKSLQPKKRNGDSDTHATQKLFQRPNHTDLRGALHLQRAEPEGPATHQTADSTPHLENSAYRSTGFIQAPTQTSRRSTFGGIQAMEKIKMDKKKGSPSRKRNVFKGSVLVSLLVESHPDRFPTRTAAGRLARRLYKDGHIRSIFGASEFEDSAQLYVWNDSDDIRKRGDGGHLGGGPTMTAPVSSSVSTPALPSSRSEARAYDQRHNDQSVDWQLIQDIKSKVLNRSETYNIVTSYNTFFQELERDFGFDHNKAQTPGSGISGRSGTTPYTSTLELKKQNSTPKSTETSVAPTDKTEKDSVQRASGGASRKEHQEGSNDSTGNPLVGEVSTCQGPLASSHRTGKPSTLKQNIGVSPRSVTEEQKIQTGKSSPTESLSHKESWPAKDSVQGHIPVGDRSPPSTASTCSPPSAVVKPHQHQKHSNYHHHQYQNQPGLRNTSVIAQSPPPHLSHQNHEKNVRSKRDPKKSAKMDPDSAVNFLNTKPFGKNFNSASPGSLSHPHGSQPSTLESGIGSSHPDSTANSSSVPLNHQIAENPNSRHHHQHYGHYPQPQASHGQQRYTKENHVSSSESQPHHRNYHHHHHQPNSLNSPPQISKYSDHMTHRGNRDEAAPVASSKKGFSPLGSNQKHGSRSGVESSQILKDVDAIETIRGLETPDNTLPSSIGARFQTDIRGGGPVVVGTMSGAGEAVNGDVRRWATEAGVVVDGNNSYSDNEKQLLEEMRRMKQEHQSVLRTYEGRVNKLMAKMHELRNIAEMLENSSNKPLPGKLTLLDILEDKDLPESRIPPTAAAVAGDEKGTGPPVLTSAGNVDGSSGQTVVPPPLPPRPSRGSRVYPNKPIIHTSVHMRPLPWNRIILDDEGSEGPSGTVWRGMREPLLDTEELERLFSGGSDRSSDVNLYDDVCLRRGRAKTQLFSIYEPERSQRIVSELRALPCTLPDVIQAFVTLNSSDLHTDSFAELLELLTSARELDKILQHVKRKGAGQLEAPEYLVYELSKVDHFRERLEFLRFKNKLQINLFEIDQQLKELNTACEEITSNLSLKNVLETVLAVGNHMNAGTDRGQADGFRVDVLNSLKDIQDTPSKLKPISKYYDDAMSQSQLKRGNLLELILRVYCLKYESGLDLGCSTRFQLPEPSNMRHAAQVSFEDIQRALKELKEELAYVRGKLEALSMKEGNTLTIALRVTSENFMTSAMEVLAEEQKLLETTRIQFWKAASYFSQDGQRSSPREFFQVWASFLHDCKYYWKLAHRNLARDRFTSDLATKSQLSSSSLPGFNSLKSTMMRHVASFNQDEEMRENRARQLEHINSWIESVGRYTLEMGPEDHEEDNYFDENDYPHQQNVYPHQQNVYHHQHEHPQQHHDHQTGHHDELTDIGLGLPENVEDRDCPTPVNQPENNSHNDQYSFNQPRHQSGESKQQKGGHFHHAHNEEGCGDEDDLSSPYYKNQPRSGQSGRSVSKRELPPQIQQQHQHQAFLQPHKSPQKAFEGEGRDQNLQVQVQTSPKPIKAIPPNVIKPQPITQASPTVSSPSPTSPHHHTIHLAQPMPRVDTNNNTQNSNKKYNNLSSSVNNTLYDGNRSGKQATHSGFNDVAESDGYSGENNFGFEPLYESLSRHAFHQPISPPSDGSETPPPYTENEGDQVLYPIQTQSEDCNTTNNVSSPNPADTDNSHKKNGNFFKTLLKRDSKQRAPSGSGEQQPHQNSNLQQGSNQHSTLRSVSAPFNKIRSSVIQKFSGNSTSKKSNSENAKSPSSPDSGTNYGKHDDGIRENPDGLEESPPKPPRGFLINQDPEPQAEGSNGSSKAVNTGVNPFHDDVVNYQNYFYPGQPRRADVAACNDRNIRTRDESGLQEYGSSGRPGGVMLVGSGHRDGHDSLPSTVSSRHSGRDQGLSMYREANSHGVSQPQSHSKDRSRRRDRSKDRLAEPSQSYDSPDRQQSRSERHTNKGGPRARSGRDRAPIALGSNVSISDMYGKALEAAGQYSEDEEAEEIKNSISSGRKENWSDAQPNSHLQQSGPTFMGKGDFDATKSISITAEPKWVKATAVPVYKAKLIPNYENQTKYDPKLEGGIRGHAGPVTSPPTSSHIRHAHQASSSSDIYRQELQKKSGQYVVGGHGTVIYQDPSNCSSLKSRNGTGSAVISSPPSSAYPGAPTSYTVLPPKFTSSHYHASPLLVSQHPSNSSQLHQPPSLGKGAQGDSGNLNGPQRSSSSPPPQAHLNQNSANHAESASSESHHIKAVAASMFTVSPDGRLELGPSREALSAEGGLSNSHKTEHSNNRVVARRSSSANNILEKTHGLSKSSQEGHGKRQYHADDNMYNSRHHKDSKEAHNGKSSQGHLSRRDNVSKKATPTSSRQPPVPQSVISLIDRFEQSPTPNASSPSSNFLHPPLMEDDKPPSMTSTPLARRKNIREEGIMVSPPVSSGRSDDASFHSHSTGSKKSSNRHHTEHHKQQSQHFSKAFDTSDKPKSHRYQKHDDHGSHAHRKYESGHKSNTKRSGSYPEVSHHQGMTDLFQDSANSMVSPESGSSNVHTPQQQNYPYDSGSSSYSSHYPHHHHPNRQTDSKSNQGGITASPYMKQTESTSIHGYSNLSSSHRDQGKEIRASSQGARSSQDHGRGQGRNLDERLTYSSQSHRHGHYHATPTFSSGSSHPTGIAYHSPFLPKPEPQYPGQPKQQHQTKSSNFHINSHQNSASSHQHISDRNLTQLRKQHGQSSPKGRGQDHQHLMSQSPASSISISTASNSKDIGINGGDGGHIKSVSHNVHRRPSPQILYISPIAPQQTSNSNGNNNNNDDNNTDGSKSNTTTTNNNYQSTESSGNDLYTAELRRAIKSSNSAFDRPLKSGPLYGRQPGAMAVVKPTVMHP